MCGERGGEVIFGANNIEGTHNSITNHHQMERFSTVMIPVSGHRVISGVCTDGWP